MTKSKKPEAKARRLARKAAKKEKTRRERQETKLWSEYVLTGHWYWVFKKTVRARQGRCDRCKVQYGFSGLVMEHQNFDRSRMWHERPQDLAIYCHRCLNILGHIDPVLVDLQQQGILTT